ncbi:MAG: 50S ribosomal protein L22 [Candidatus Dormibacteria bacterium]
MKVVATAKDVRITSRKARVVADSVVGLPVAEALALLSFTPRHAAKEVAKVIKSAAANAEHNFNLEQSSLRVDRIDVDQAGMMKRYIAKPRGMAGSIFKRMSHLRCYVTDEEPEPERRRRSVVAMAGRAVHPSTKPASARRRRPAQIRRAQEAALAEAEAATTAVEGAAEGEPVEEVEPTPDDEGDVVDEAEPDETGDPDSEAGGPGDEEPEAETAQDDEEKD